MGERPLQRLSCLKQGEEEENMLSERERDREEAYLEAGLHYARLQAKLPPIPADQQECRDCGELVAQGTLHCRCQEHHPAADVLCLLCGTFRCPVSEQSHYSDRPKGYDLRCPGA